MTPTTPPAPPPAPSSTWARTLIYALIAFILGISAVGGGVGQVRFLISAYHHGGL